MATPSALPQPSRLATSTPTGDGPSSKLKTPSATSSLPRAASPNPSKLRPPSSPRPSQPSSGIASPRSVSGTPRSSAANADNPLRRSVSIAAFPQPPKSPGGSVGSPTLTSKGSSPDLSKAAGAGKKGKVGSGPTAIPSRRSSKQTPSMLSNGSEAKAVVNGNIEGPSSPQSRSSSAQGSYSTSATTLEEPEDAGRQVADAGESSKKSGRKDKGNVIVSVRVKPDLGGADNRSEGEWLVDGRRAMIAFKGKEISEYYYDNVFTAHDNNAKVYDAAAKRLVRRVMEGYHGTVFAYGMTGTGKTFSMQGTASSPGVIPLAITDIFSYIRETPHREFLLRVSYLEIYNEKIHDLLSPPQGNGIGGAQPEEIKLREDSKRGVYATPLKEEIVQSPTQLLRVIARGDNARRTAGTQFNARSSRSHAVVQIVVESRERNPGGSGAAGDKRSGIMPGGVRVSTLSLIDLAGSERAAESKERRQEGAHINKSLLTLGNVIAKLAESKEKGDKYLPYRDSKLTRLLQPALSGNSLVSILCTIQLGSAGSSASANTHTTETLNTLKFAARAKNNIVSHAKRAEESYAANGDGGSRVLLERYRQEIQSLRAQLESQAKAQAEKEAKLEQEKMEREAAARHEEQMLEIQLARTALKERIEHLNRLILSSKSMGVNSQPDRFSRISVTNESGTRSLRSSASQSTIEYRSLRRAVSQMSMRSGAPASRSSLVQDDDDDTIGEFGDGVASLQMQVAALQADLSDKNRYINTLERRLLQARRASQSRMSSLSQLKNADESELIQMLREKDLEIQELRAQLDDKDRMLTALRSAARQRDIAQMAADLIGPRARNGHLSQSSNTSSLASAPAAVGDNGHNPLQSPDKPPENRRKSMDEVSRMLDEMIQDRVEQGHLVKSSRGSMRVVSGIMNPRNSVGPVPPLRAPSPGREVKESKETKETKETKTTQEGNPETSETAS
ncbi:hypothetical protein VTN49DRAFT_2119 [Thermomyces lanuginosus]|uniref:uncharacterized protein n=1 Tax=Thermomyces lanuginosus TaxID=5541 RepID=UPI003743BE69